jgi:hypothetical protein
VSVRTCRVCANAQVRLCGHARFRADASVVSLGNFITDAKVRPCGHAGFRADTSVLSPGNFITDATVRPSHGRLSSHCPIVRPSIIVCVTTLMTRSTSHSLECRPSQEPPTHKLQGHLWWVLIRMNCLMSRQHWSLIVTCHNGTLQGSPIGLVVNAMPNRQPPMSSALLGLPRTPKALLLQHTREGKLNMMGPR